MTLRPAYLLAILAALVGAALVWSVLPAGFVQVPDGPSPTPGVSASASPPEPSLAPPAAGFERTEWFGVPFDYRIPAGSGLTLMERTQFDSLIAWVDGPAREPENYAGQEGSASGRGIVVAKGERAWSDGVGGRTPISQVPHQFLVDLDTLANMEVGAVAATEVDGRPALEARAMDDQPNQIHVGPINVADAQPFATMTMPSDLIVFEVRETTLFIQIWARTEEELTAFLPTAQEFVDSIQFVEQVPAAVGLSSDFLSPFEYVIPEGSRLVPEDGDEHLHVIRWAADGEYGITVAAGEEPWGHSPRGRFSMSGPPARVVQRIQDIGALDLEPVSPRVLDGMPALMATIDDRDATDIHVGTESLPYVNYFQLNEPSVLIVSSVDGNVVFITIWARTAEARDAFLPMANEFVGSIDFIDAP